MAEPELLYGQVRAKLHWGQRAEVLDGEAQFGGQGTKQAVDLGKQDYVREIGQNDGSCYLLP